jgi:hypothetical protein
MRKERKPESFKEALEKTQATFLVVLSGDSCPTLEWCEEWRTAPRATLHGVRGSYLNHSRAFLNHTRANNRTASYSELPRSS